MTNRVIRKLWVSVTLSCAATTAVLAHHSAVRFDQESVVPIEGAITRYVWRSPHVYVYVADATGEEWELEGASPQLMTRLGWSADLFAPGDRVSVRANPDIDPSRAHGLIVSIETVDGGTFSAQRTGIPRPTESDHVSASDLNGVWRGEDSLVRELLSNLASHPLTGKGQAARAEYVEDMNPVVDCVAFPTPFIVAANATYLTEIELRDDRVLFRNEFYNAERTIFTDGRDHPQDGQRTNQGHSIGRWEGDTLVVDSRLFTESRAPFPTIGIPSGLQKHVVERYTLTEDGTQALVEVWMEDPEYLTAPLEATFVWSYAPYLEILSYECDPDVARRFVQ